MLPILSFCTAEQPWLLETIEALARLESPTTDKAAVDRCGSELATRLRAMGGLVTQLPRERTGDLVRAEFGPTTSAAEPILMLGHFDTVWPVGQLARMPCETRDGRLWGPGVFDMKSGIALGMLAVRALQALVPARRRPIVMLWTTDEEVGSAASRELLEDEARRSAAVLVLEPSLPGGAVKTARKGCGQFEVTVTGVAAHAGLEPQRGASALAELAHQILRINALQDLERGVLVNVVRANGGLQSNVIPEHAHALVDVRVPTPEAWGELSAAIVALPRIDPRTSIDRHGVLNRPPLERTPGVVELYETARAVAGELGLTLGEGESGGGSDGNFTAALGVPTLDGLGAVGAGAHALDEHVLVDALAPRAALIAGLLARLDALTLRR